MNTWYCNKTSSDQGLVADETTGRNIAVTYDGKDAPLVAAAPDLIEALKALFDNCAMIHKNWGDNDNSRAADEAISRARAAIAKAELISGGDK